MTCIAHIDSMSSLSADDSYISNINVLFILSGIGGYFHQRASHFRRSVNHVVPDCRTRHGHSFYLYIYLAWFLRFLCAPGTNEHHICTIYKYSHYTCSQERCRAEGLPRADAAGATGRSRDRQQRQACQWAHAQRLCRLRGQAAAAHLLVRAAHGA